MQFENNEQRLIQAAKNGDRDAFEQIYILYSKRVYCYVNGILRDYADAEDITAEVFIKVMRALPKYSEKGQFAAWIYRIARNEAFNHIKKKHRHRELPLLESAAIGDGPETEIEERDLLRKTHEAMQYLTDLQREVLTLRFGEELSIKETAAIMKRSIQAVKFLQVSALRALRRQMKTDEDLKNL